MLIYRCNVVHTKSFYAPPLPTIMLFYLPLLSPSLLPSPPPSYPPYPPLPIPRILLSPIPLLFSLPLHPSPPLPSSPCHLHSPYNILFLLPLIHCLLHLQHSCIQEIQFGDDDRRILWCTQCMLHGPLWATYENGKKCDEHLWCEVMANCFNLHTHQGQTF